jgi:hypothetical protein
LLRPSGKFRQSEEEVATRERRRGGGREEGRKEGREEGSLSCTKPEQFKEVPRHCSVPWEPVLLPEERFCSFIFTERECSMVVRDRPWAQVHILTCPVILALCLASLPQLLRL